MKRVNSRQLSLYAYRMCYSVRAVNLHCRNFLNKFSLSDGPTINTELYGICSVFPLVEGESKLLMWNENQISM